MQSMPDASPTKWHLAHTAWFFETFVLRRAPPVARPSFDYLFNSYYEAVGPRHPRAARGLLTRPSLDEVRRYRQQVDERVLGSDRARRSATTCAPAIVAGPAPRAAAPGAAPHRHQAPLRRPPRLAAAIAPRAGTAPPAARPRRAPALGWIARPGGVVEIGAATPGASGEPFAFDNESPRHQVLLRPYAIGVAPGHLRRVPRVHDATAATGGPSCGCRTDGRRSPPSAVTRAALLGATRAAVHAGRRAAADRRRAGRSRQLLRGRRVRALGGGAAADGGGMGSGGGHRAGRRDDNLADSRRSTRGPPPPRARAASSRQVHGDVWEWTASAYLPYPGYRAAAGALGEYNGKFMSNQMVLRGGSCVTPRASHPTELPELLSPRRRAGSSAASAWRVTHESATRPRPTCTRRCGRRPRARCWRARRWTAAVAEILRGALDRPRLAAGPVLDRRARRSRAALPVDLGVGRAEAGGRRGGIACRGHRRRCQGRSGRPRLREPRTGLDRGPVHHSACRRRPATQDGAERRIDVVIVVSDLGQDGVSRRDRALLVAQAGAG